MKKTTISGQHLLRHEHEDETDKHKAWPSVNPVQNSHEEHPPTKAAARKIGRPSVTTSAKPLAGAIPVNMQGQTTRIDRVEELEEGEERSRYE